MASFGYTAVTGPLVALGGILQSKATSRSLQQRSKKNGQLLGFNAMAKNTSVNKRNRSALKLRSVNLE